MANEKQKKRKASQMEDVPGAQYVENADRKPKIRRRRRRKTQKVQQTQAQNTVEQVQVEQNTVNLENVHVEGNAINEKLLQSHEKVWNYVCKNPNMVKPNFNLEPNWTFDVIEAPAPMKTRHLEVTVFNRKMDVLVTCEADRVTDWLKKQDSQVYGMDIEWKPNRAKGVENKVALLQICSETECLVVQTLFLDRIPDELVKFLADPSKKLGGIGIRQDAKKLKKDFSLECQGIVELCPLAIKKLNLEELSGTGLKKLALVVLGLALDKPKWVTMSNWAKRHLDLNQVNYACVDAWVSYAMLQKLLTWE